MSPFCPHFGRGRNGLISVSTNENIIANVQDMRHPKHLLKNAEMEMAVMVIDGAVSTAALCRCITGNAGSRVDNRINNMGRGVRQTVSGDEVNRMWQLRPRIECLGGKNRSREN
ncbi:hypothetical protein TNCV_3297151 [Trichonephila clavipes]|uniref:Uncharacterized protein n=1 Tax=Trichonephila clavipes TaxID=2585209 RepID=A0A8X6T7E0_TRICX|nr:hypothetical protein TNCV_3297151 [Trichonephila clavipes]